MKIWLKIHWRQRHKLLQQAATSSILYCIVAFINTKLLPTNLLWLLWCGILINSGQEFWQANTADKCHEYWINKNYAEKIITNKWRSKVLFTSIFWFLIWGLWSIIFNIAVPLKFLVATIFVTIPIVFGFSIITSALTANIIASTNLLSFITMPIIIPVLIYGSGIFLHLERHEDPGHILAGLLALAILSFLFTPFLSYRVLRMGARS